MHAVRHTQVGQSQRHKHAHARARPRLLRRRLKRRRPHSRVCSPGPHPAQTSPGRSTKRTGKAVEETSSVYQTCLCVYARTSHAVKKMCAYHGGKGNAVVGLEGISPWWYRPHIGVDIFHVFSRDRARFPPTNHTLLAVRSPPLRSCRASRFSSLQNSRPWISAVQR